MAVHQLSAMYRVGVCVKYRISDACIGGYTLHIVHVYCVHFKALHIHKYM
jgi:hypothetical protein